MTVCVCMKNEKRIQLQSYTSFSLRSHSSYVQLVSSVLSSEPSKAHEILLLRVYEVFVCAFLNNIFDNVRVRRRATQTVKYLIRSYRDCVSGGSSSTRIVFDYIYFM